MESIYNRIEQSKQLADYKSEDTSIQTLTHTQCTCDLCQYERHPLEHKPCIYTRIHNPTGNWLSRLDPVIQRTLSIYLPTIPQPCSYIMGRSYSSCCNIAFTSLAPSDLNILRTGEMGDHRNRCMLDGGGGCKGKIMHTVLFKH